MLQRELEQNANTQFFRGINWPQSGAIKLHSIQEAKQCPGWSLTDGANEPVVFV